MIEDDDIICLDSDYEPSTQPRIKNEPIRAPLAPINANCSPIKKRKLLDNENSYPKKRKMVENDENDDIIFLDSNCEPSTPPRQNMYDLTLDNSPLHDLRIPYR